MDDLLAQQRIYEILNNKIAMGMGYDDDDMGYGSGVLLEGLGSGVSVGGRRRRRAAPRRKKRPSAFNRRVAAYMRKYGVTLGEAARALRGSGAGEYEGEGYRRKRRRRAPARRRRSYGYGGIDPIIAAHKKRLIDEELAEEENLRKRLCAKERMDRIYNKGTRREIIDMENYCGVNPLAQRRKARKYKNLLLDDLAYDEYTKKKK